VTWRALACWRTKVHRDRSSCRSLRTLFVHLRDGTMENLVDPDRKLPGADAIEFRFVGVESAFHPQNLQRPFQLGTVVELESRYLDRAANLLELRKPDSHAPELNLC